MFSVTRSRLATLATCWWVAASLPLAASAQVRTFAVEAEPRVVNGTLQIDVFIRRTSAVNFPLNDCNLNLVVDGAGVDVSRATLDPVATGPWDISADPRSYRAMRVFVLPDNMLSLNVYGNTGLSNSVAHLGGVGPGRTLNLARERMARIVIPITNPVHRANVSWRPEVMSLADWSGAERIQQGLFTVTTPTVVLCETPAAPQLTAPPAPICNATSVITSSGVGTHIWSRNGTILPGQSGNTLPVTQSGTYTARLAIGSCESAPAAPVTVTVVPNAVPHIQLMGTEFRLTTDGVDGTLQWFRNDQVLPGANRTFLPATESGVYYVQRTTACGTTRSNLLPFQRAGSPTDTRDTAYATVAPNPYVESTTLTYVLTQPAHVTVEASNVNGIIVRKLVDQHMEAGTHRYPFSVRALGLAAGTYLLRVKAGPLDQTFKLVEAK